MCNVYKIDDIGAVWRMIGMDKAEKFVVGHNHEVKIIEQRKKQKI